MSNILWKPQPKQIEFMERPEFEVLYGGAAGGGKSDALLIEVLRQIDLSNYRAIIFRDTYPQLEALISRSMELYKPAFPEAKYNQSDKVWRFPSGAKIFFGYMQRDADKYNYQGKSYDVICFDELTHFTFEMYQYLKSRCRPTGKDKKGRQTIQYIRSTCNPEGKGMGWVKERFVTPAPPKTRMYENVKVQTPNGEWIEMTRDRIFIPSTVFDNKELLAQDPGYLATLASLPKAERDALLYGSWDSFTGQVFTEWKNDPEHYKDRKWTHVIDPFRIPDSWKIMRSFDFGYSKPFSVGWTAVDHEGRMYRIAEWYGCDGTPNHGLKLTPIEIAKGIKQMEENNEFLKGRKIIHCVADPAIFERSTGESIADMMDKEFVYWSPGDHTRLAGKMQYHYRLAFDEYGDPMFQTFNTCKDFIRCIPLLIYSDKHPEDIDTDMEDHNYDECRYAFMEHPIAPRVNEAERIDLNDPLNQRETHKPIWNY
ncbi:MAG: terminase family protein [Pseudobutyrivibrio sp.]|nr:terminase family protein [Pseudobutyrivibrio sp.]